MPSTVSGGARKARSARRFSDRSVGVPVFLFVLELRDGLVLAHLFTGFPRLFDVGLAKSFGADGEVGEQPLELGAAAFRARRVRASRANEHLEFVTAL